MKPFKEVKEEVLKRGRMQNPYKVKEFLKNTSRATNKIELLNAITANWRWCLVDTRMIDVTFLEKNFTEAELSEAGIYTRGTHEARSMAIFACGSSTVKACGSSTVEAYDSSTVEAYDNSYVDDTTGKCTQPDDYAIVRDYHNKKIYIKKGVFEIIEVE